MLTPWLSCLVERPDASPSHDHADRLVIGKSHAVRTNETIIDDELQDAELDARSTAVHDPVDALGVTARERSACIRQSCARTHTPRNLT